MKVIIKTTSSLLVVVMKTKTIQTLLQILTQHRILREKSESRGKIKNGFLIIISITVLYFTYLLFITIDLFPTIFNPNREMDLFLCVDNISQVQKGIHMKWVFTKKKN